MRFGAGSVGCLWGLAGGGKFDVGFVEIGEELEFGELEGVDGLECVEEFEDSGLAGGVGFLGHFLESGEVVLGVLAECFEGLLMGLEALGSLLELGAELGFLEL